MFERRGWKEQSSLDKMILTAAILVFGTLHVAHGHGRLLEPPNRSSLWRFQSTDPAIIPYADIIEPNYNDNQLYCGGYQHQVNLGYKCGVCGDPYDGVRDNEAGGKYAKGIIVRQYAPGSTMKIEVELTAYHKGFFEFRLCVWNNVHQPITFDCLDKHLLPLFNNGSTRYYPSTPSSSNSEIYTIYAELPANVECDQCVVQWKYHTGNTESCEELSDGTKKCCVGCGPQEEFYGCADVAIGYGLTSTPIIATSTATTRSTTKVTSTTTTSTSATENQGSGAVTCPNSPGYHNYDCNRFYNCIGSDMYIYGCGPGTVFDENRSLCDFPANVPPPCGTKL